VTRSALCAVALFAAAARADDGVVSGLESRESRPTNALEVTAGLGSAQGYGNVIPGGPNLGDLGLGADLGIGWRINPRWMVGVYSGVGYFPGSPTDSSFDLSAGAQASYHFASRWQPWVGLGAGWHGYWLTQGGATTAWQGFDLARLQAGFDVPLTPSFSISPMLGMTLTTFLWQKEPNVGSFAGVKSSGVSVFVLAGAQARFDFFGRPSRPELLAGN